uniref:Ribonuclease 3 (RNase III)) n=1 Tax=Ganoderma boninense TaxID=34458 RepID=A0A5K1K1B4_9APHY|nr:Ribonuclease 3 (EC (Ribonuclease III) (RNase III) [Ganoderma boninense]
MPVVGQPDGDDDLKLPVVGELPVDYDLRLPVVGVPADDYDLKLPVVGEASGSICIIDQANNSGGDDFTEANEGDDEDDWAELALSLPVVGVKICTPSCDGNCPKVEESEALSPSAEIPAASLDGATGSP